MRGTAWMIIVVAALMAASWAVGYRQGMGRGRPVAEAPRAARQKVTVADEAKPSQREAPPPPSPTPPPAVEPKPSSGPRRLAALPADLAPTTITLTQVIIQVIDESTGQPAPKVSAWLIPTSGDDSGGLGPSRGPGGAPIPLKGMTNAQGELAHDEVVPGRYHATVKPASRPIVDFGEVEVLPQPENRLELALPAAANPILRVLDPSGAPKPGEAIDVEVTTQTRMAEDARGPVAARVVTNADGKAELPLDRLGDYRSLRFHAANPRLLLSTGRLGPWSPWAQLNEFSAGGHGIVSNLPNDIYGKVPPLEATLRVVNAPDLRPGERLVAKVISPRTFAVLPVEANELAFPAEPDVAYTFMVGRRAPDTPLDGYDATTSATFAATPERPVVEVPYPTLLSVPGQVLGPEGEPLAGFVAYAQATGPGLDGATPSASSAPSDDGGVFSIGLAEARRYQLTAMPASRIEPRFHAGGPATARLDWPRLSSGEPVILRFPPAEYRHAKGVVVTPEGRPAAGARVWLVGGNLNTYSEVSVADADGAFDLKAEKNQIAQATRLYDGTSCVFIATQAGYSPALAAGGFDDAQPIRLPLGRGARVEIHCADPKAYETLFLKGPGGAEYEFGGARLAQFFFIDTSKPGVHVIENATVPSKLRVIIPGSGTFAKPNKEATITGPTRIDVEAK